MNNEQKCFYDGNFYEHLAPGMANSAAVVLGLLFEHFKPESVIDVGCGWGAWLKEAEKLGAQDLQGIDGIWVEKEKLLSPKIVFEAANFEKQMPKIYRKFDLCISLEVAEHITPGRLPDFLDLLCSASNNILFSAAIKGQGGINHINEQWQSYWLNLFKQRGFEPLDIFRNKLWDNPCVEWWYKQNIFLLVGPNNNALNIAELKKHEKPITNIVHPLNFEGKINYYLNQREHPTLQFCLSCFKKYLRDKLCTLRSLFKA